MKIRQWSEMQLKKVLTEMSAPTVSSKCGNAKQHLCPAKYWVYFSNYTMSNHSIWSYRLFMYMKFQVDSKNQLANDWDEKYRRERFMHRPREHATFMSVA